jgi:outer membrane immunogenic protein
MQPDGDNKTVRFDKTLDGNFSDTITTAAGANAFSPRFCNGAAVTATPGDGCRQDDRAPDFAARGAR